MSKQTDFPVVIIHQGYSFYLKIAILQAKLYFERVVLIGDSSNEKLKEYVEFYNIRDLEDSATKGFSEVYQHLSTNSLQFELACFNRWFILHRFMEINNLNLAMHLDSDVILCSDFKNVLSEFNDKTLAAFHVPKQKFNEYRWTAVGHTSLWTFKGLRKLKKFLSDTYKNNSKQLYEKWDWHQSGGKRGGICDMTLLYLFFLENEAQIINLAKTRKTSDDKKYTSDTNINSSENYKKQEFVMQQSVFLLKHKKLDKKEVGYIGYSVDKQPVKFESLHCQGKAKILMYSFYEGSIDLKIRIEYYKFANPFIWERTLGYARYLKSKFLK